VGTSGAVITLQRTSIVKINSLYSIFERITLSVVVGSHHHDRPRGGRKEWQASRIHIVLKRELYKHVLMTA